MSGARPPYDPYAPPREEALGTPLPPAPLPEGIRRYGIDVGSYRARVGQALRARIVRGVLIGIAYFIFLVRGARLPLESLYVAIPIWGIVLGASYLLARARVRSAESRILQGYELLVSPRVLRRTAFGALPAEILAPEVTSIVEIPEGLSIASLRPRRSLLVTRSLAGFAEVRDHLRAWAPIEAARRGSPIEPRHGLRAYLRRLSHLWREKTRDQVDGALALDPTLLGELTAVRTLAMPFDPGSVRKRRSLRILIILWILIVLVFVVWQLAALTSSSRT